MGGEAPPAWRSMLESLCLSARWRGDVAGVKPFEVKEVNCSGVNWAAFINRCAMARAAGAAVADFQTDSLQAIGFVTDPIEKRCFSVCVLFHARR